MNVKYRVTLDRMVLGGKGAFRRLKRAQILLAADAGSPDEVIAKNVSVGTSTAYRTKQRFVKERLGASPCSSLWRARSHPRALALDLAAVGRRDGALDLARLGLGRDDPAAGELQLKPWQEKMWCIPKVDVEFVARMEDVLALYAEPPDERRPVVCFDERPRQLIGEERVPVCAEPGKRRRSDYE